MVSKGKPTLSKKNDTISGQFLDVSGWSALQGALWTKAAENSGAGVVRKSARTASLARNAALELICGGPESFEPSCGRAEPKFGRIEHTLGRLEPHRGRLERKFGRLELKVDGVRLNIGRFKPKWSNNLQIWSSGLCRACPLLGRFHKVPVMFPRNFVAGPFSGLTSFSRLFAQVLAARILDKSR